MQRFISFLCIFASMKVKILITLLTILSLFSCRKSEKLKTVICIPVYGQSLALGIDADRITNLDSLSNYADGRIVTENLDHQFGYYNLDKTKLFLQKLFHYQKHAYELTSYSMAQYLASNTGRDTLICIFAGGQDGTIIAELGKGSIPYEKLIRDIKTAYQSANERGWDFIIPALCWMQGETDVNSYPGTNYQELLLKLTNDINHDIKQITGQEKDIEIEGKKFHLYVVKSDKITSRKYNYVSLCANSRVVGTKRNLADVDSLYNYPITENGEAKFIDIYVVSEYLDNNINNARTTFKIPEKADDVPYFEGMEKVVTIEDILRGIANEVATMYETYAVETKKRNIEEVKNYITTTSPEYRSFLLRDDVLEAMPPNLTDEKKGVAYTENKKIAEQIDKFIQLREVNEEEISGIIDTIKRRTAYDADNLVAYVTRRKAIISVFEKMLEMKENGKYELESMIHNLIFPMGLTNESVNYQYHNLWLLDDRFSTFRYIASDKSITSMSQIRSSKEPDIVMINDDHLLVNNAISYGDKVMGEVGSMVIKRPGDTAHQKKKTDNRWEFSELVEKYFEDFLYGKEKKKKNWKGQKVHVTEDTPKYGYVVMDEMSDELIRYNKNHQWRKTPFGSYYKINPDLNLHIEAMDFHTLLKNAKERNNPFFDHLFTSKM